MIIIYDDRLTFENFFPQSVVSEPTAVDGISKRMNHVFGQSGKVSE